MKQLKLEKEVNQLDLYFSRLESDLQPILGKIVGKEKLKIITLVTFFSWLRNFLFIFLNNDFYFFHDSWFIVFCQFLLHDIVTQSHTHTHRHTYVHSFSHTLVIFN